MLLIDVSSSKFFLYDVWHLIHGQPFLRAKAYQMKFKIVGSKNFPDT